jgi:hypothetical protein
LTPSLNYLPMHWTGVMSKGTLAIVAAPEKLGETPNASFALTLHRVGCIRGFIKTERYTHHDAI